MKVCESCKAEYPDSETRPTCAKCGFTLPQTAVSADPTVAHPTPLTIRSTFPPRREGTPPPLILSSPGGANSSPRRTEPLAEEDVDEDPAPANDTFNQARTERQAPIPPPTTTGMSRSQDLSDEELAAIKASGRFTIGLLGYPACGKTWFLNRLKWKYENNRGRGSYVIEPPAAEDDELVNSTDWVEPHSFTYMNRRARREKAKASPANDPAGTVARTGAEPQSAEQARSKSFNIIDIPGERFLDAVSARFRGELSRGLIRSLHVCHALVIMLPAGELLVPAEAEPSSEELEPQGRGEQRSAHSMEMELKALQAALSRTSNSKRMRKGEKRDAVEALRREAEAEIKVLQARIDERRARELRDAHLRLGRFIRGVARLSAAASLLNKPKAPGEPCWTPEELIAMPGTQLESLIEKLDSEDASPPVYVALSKADQVDDGLQAFMQRTGMHAFDLNNFDKDPLHLVRQLRNDLYVGLNRDFTLCKFDFLTAFGDHHEGLRIRYDRRFHGVQAVVDWIDWAQRRSNTHPALRWDAPVARALKWVRDRAAPPLRGGSDGGARAAGGWIRAWRAPGHYLAAAIDSALGSGPWEGLAWSAGCVALAALLCFYCMGLVSLGDQPSIGPAPAIAPRPVYPIELARMQQASPLVTQGLLVDVARPWSTAPSDGLLFSVGKASHARASLDRALQETREAEDQQPVSAKAADAIIETFKSADSALQHDKPDDPGRSVIDYHQGLLYAWSGRFGQAQQHFRAVLRRIADYRNKTAQFDQLSPISLARLTGVEAATHYALGLSLLQAADPDLKQAAAEFRQAGGEVGLMGTDTDEERTARAQVAPLKSRSDYFFELDPAALAVMETGDLAANLVATDIRLDDAARSPEEMKAAQAALAGDLHTWSNAAEAVNQRLELSANLLVAAVRTGDAAGVGRFEPDAELIAGDDVNKVAELVKVAALADSPANADAQATGWPDKAWTFTRSWRALFAAKKSAELRSSLLAVQAQTDAPPADKDYLRRWQSQVVHTAALDVKGGERRGIVRAYASTLANDDRDVLHDARAPFGSLMGAVLSVGAMLAAALFIVAFWRLRHTYWNLFGSNHHRDRTKGKAA